MKKQTADTAQTTEKKYLINISGEVTKENIRELLTGIADDFSRRLETGAEQMNASNGSLSATLHNATEIKNSELFDEVFTYGIPEEGDDYFKGDGQISSTPEQWSISDEDGGCYYYDFKSDYINDCNYLGIDTNL